ncbi:MAG: acyl-CoA dehydrogenase family protein [Candidatus Nanopelagicales bacterium]|nr:acyl-CoA dehydrogenase family protein [Candidatus Nanopelagicales bacterium]
MEAEDLSVGQTTRPKFRAASVDTHSVLNQPPPLEDYDVFSADTALVEALTEFAGDQNTDGLSKLGRLSGSAQVKQWATEADTFTPQLKAFDRYGQRIDEVEFHPAWHSLMTEAVGHGLHAAAWTSDDPYAHSQRAAGFMSWYQAEAGHGCPISMTYAAVPALKTDPAVAAQWVPGLSSATYDFGLRSPQQKAGLIAGMSMTEKQGGSDVRANTTIATPLPGEDGAYALDGHKWFCSAPMSDIFLVLAQAEGGLTCFVVPRVLADGTRNVFRIQRLKEKLGNRSNASAEIEFSNTWAQRLGDEGRGVRTIVEMVSATRLDCVLGSTALMRKALSEAAWHAAHRSAFGATLIDQPLMRQVLADLAIEVEAATWLSMRLAAATDASVGARPGQNADSEAALRRLALPMSKYFVCKRAPYVVFESMECLGGAGYVEETGLPRLYREAPVNSIWEGSGNVNALDLLRALSRSPESLDAWLAEVGAASGTDRNFDTAVTDLLDTLSRGAATDEASARQLAERMALLLQGSVLLRHAPNPVADAFCATRLSPQGTARTFGVLPAGVDTDLLIDRAFPAEVG